MSHTPASDALRADHRRIEIHLDTLLAGLLQLTPERIPGIAREFEEIRRLAVPHFLKEENVMYPRLRFSVPGLLARLEEQHEHTRELERHVAELLAEPPSARQMDELRRLGIEYHDSIQHHIVEEEDHLLRVADGELSAEEQTALEREMRTLEG